MTVKEKLHRICQISLALTVVLGVGQATSQPTAAATLYSIIDLGNLGRSSVLSVSDINNLGQVVGYSTTTNTPQHAFRTASNSPINPETDDLGTLGGTNNYSYANAINDLGQVVGYSDAVSSNQRVVFRTAPNSPINPDTDSLGFGRSTSGKAINNLGQVVVDQIIPRFGSVGVFRTAPNSPDNGLSPDNIGNLGGLLLPYIVPAVSGSAINDLGQVVGTSINTSLQFHAFRTAPNSPINPATDDLGTLGGSRSSASDINNLGQVVGNSTTASGETHAFRTAPNSPINPATDDLGTLGGSSSNATIINNLGQVVGEATTASGEGRAFLYDFDQMFDLNDLIPADFGVILTVANVINDQGQIAATGFTRDLAPSNRDQRIFLLTPIVSTPIPEPSDDLIPADLGVILNYASDINDQGQIAAGRSITNLALSNRVFLSPTVSTPIPEPSSILGTLAISVLFLGSVQFKI